MNTLDSYNPQGWLLWFLKGTLFVVALVLFARLAELQIIKGNYYRTLSDGNRIRKITILAPRGQIKDSNGNVIAGNVPIKKKVIFTNEGYEKSLDVKDAHDSEIIIEAKRNYFLGEAAAHVTGYLGEPSEDEVGKIDPSCPEKGPLSLGSMVGKSGLEVMYDCKLRGIDGEELIEVDAHGKPLRILGVKKPIPGSDLSLNIVSALQQKIPTILASQKDLQQPLKASVIVSTPDGKMLALYSSPTYNPNVFTNKVANDIERILTDKNLPLFDRNINGLYHPGSTYKVVTSIAALEKRVIDKSFTYTDTGIIQVNDFSYTNWYFSQYGRTEGEVDLSKALARSTDTFFYKVGELVGVDAMAEWSDKFGLSKKTGIDLPYESSGLIPTPAWKRQTKGELWFLGNTYHMAIGQGDVATTPLEVNTLVATIANKGSICTPNLNTENEPNCHSLNISGNNLDLVIEGMVKACSDGGTAYPFFDFKPQVACKTGTAETNEVDKTHAWFTVFAPVEKPEVVVTVLVEKAGEGSKVAAPIAKEILNFYFNQMPKH